MATVKIHLDKRKAKSDGSFPICFLIYHNRKTTTRSCKLFVKERDWDDTEKSIKKTNPQHKVLNLKLRKSFADLQSQLLLATDDEVGEYLKPVAQVIEVVEQKKTLYQFAQVLIDQMRADGQIGNAWVYESTVNALKLFHPNGLLYFEDVDYQFLTKYNSHLVAKDIKHNSIYLYIRTLRIFYNKAIKSKLVDRSLYPFDDYKLRPEKTKKRAVDVSILTKMKQAELPFNSAHWHARNYFLLSFYLIGISIVDLSLLKNNNVQYDRLTYKRRKTGKWYDIKLHPQAIEIFNFYQNTPEYLLPISKTGVGEEVLIRGIKSKTKLINKHLAQIAKELKIEYKITTYTSRHSWATLAKKAGFSIELIAEALGHEYGNRTTAVYLDTFDQNVVDDANAKVIDSLDQ
jgi:integrase/recombinase XerD